MGLLILMCRASTLESEFTSEIAKLKEIIQEDREAIDSYEKKIEFLEQTHLSKSNFYSNKEKSYVEKLKNLQNQLDEGMRKLKEIKDKEAEKTQKWRIRSKQLQSTLALVQSNGESEWLNVYNNLMEQIHSLKKDVDQLKVEKEILTKRAKIYTKR